MSVTGSYAEGEPFYLGLNVTSLCFKIIIILKKEENKIQTKYEIKPKLISNIYKRIMSIYFRAISSIPMILPSD